MRSQLCPPTLLDTIKKQPSGTTEHGVGHPTCISVGRDLHRAYAPNGGPSQRDSRARGKRPVVSSLVVLASLVSLLSLIESKMMLLAQLHGSIFSLW